MPLTIPPKRKKQNPAPAKEQKVAPALSRIPLEFRKSHPRDEAVRKAQLAVTAKEAERLG